MNVTAETCKVTDELSVRAHALTGEASSGRKNGAGLCALSLSKLTDTCWFPFKIVCLYCHAKKHGIKSLESWSMSVKYPNLATCFEFNCLKPMHSSNSFF